MPAPYTHHTFVNDVFRNLDKTIQDKLTGSKNVLCLFGQSFDLLHYVRLPKKNMASYCHTHSVNLYFKNIVSYIRDNNLEMNGDVLAYLYGSICHYVLDSVCHPFICYSSGVYHWENKKTLKYRGMHAYIEFMIDAIIYKERNNSSIHKFNMGRIAPKFRFSKPLVDTISYAYLETFQIPKMGVKVNKAYLHSNFIYRIGMTDKTGIKTLIYKMVDKTNLIKGIYLENYAYHIKTLDLSVLNLEHEKWCYPTRKELVYHYSFYDLYDIALEKAKDYIVSLDKALSLGDKEVRKALEKIGNNKYTTGLVSGGVMKYFKF